MNKKVFLAIVVLCAFCAITAKAQTATKVKSPARAAAKVKSSTQTVARVKSFTLTTDHISSKDRRSDLNGSPCALVKVQVVGDIERIEGNKIGDVVNWGVEKWVYMCKGSRNMRIHLKNHLPIKVMFQDYHINGLEGNRVYELVLDIPDVPQTAPVQDVKLGTFKVNVSPRTATVTIWGDNMQRRSYHPQDDGTLTVELPYGRYNYSVQAEGYRDFESDFFAIDNTQWESVNLSPIEGSLYISCSTANVDFTINGKGVDKKRRETTWMGQVPPGQYAVTASRKGFVTQTKTVNVLANQTAMVSFGKLMTNAQQAAAERKAEKEKRRGKKKQKAMQLGAETEPVAANRQIISKHEKSQSWDDIYRLNRKAKKEGKAKRKATNKPKMYSTRTDGRSVVFGCQAGVNLASLEVTDGECDMKAGFHVGTSADFRLSKSLYLNTSILFSQKGYQWEQGWGDGEDVTAMFVMLPIQLSYRIGMLQINAGPYLDYGIGGTIDYSYEDTDTFDYYKTLNFGVTAGLGVTIARHFYIGANYELGFSDYANRNIAVSLGYKF